MTKPRAKRIEHRVSPGDDNRVSAEGGVSFEIPPGFEAEHLVLAGLVRCTRTSLAYNARRIGVSVERVSGTASSIVTRRESDGRYGFVDVACKFDVSLDPRPDEETLAALLAKTERDCFVGASLTAPPTYDWTVA